MKAIWSSAAERDLEEIIYYIAVVVGRPLVAEKIGAEIKTECEKYAEHPLIGEAEHRLGPNFRRFIHKRWGIFSRPQDDGIDILRVIDGARDFDRLF